MYRELLVDVFERPFVTPTSAEMHAKCDEFIQNIHQPFFNQILEDSDKSLVLKIKWIQQTTDKATLVRTKSEWFWIPLSLINSIKKTKKGWKIKVIKSFKPTPIIVDTHHYFERQEYES